ncbi:MAG: hypothetical protein IJ736_15915, partial [Firmicutes bacterium]|nr:hypothetical protein [Bacillota bacterium]
CIVSALPEFDMPIGIALIVVVCLIVLWPFFVKGDDHPNQYGMPPFSTEQPVVKGLSYVSGDSSYNNAPTPVPGDNKRSDMAVAVLVLIIILLVAGFFIMKQSSEDEWEIAQADDSYDTDYSSYSEPVNSYTDDSYSSENYVSDDTIYNYLALVYPAANSYLDELVWNGAYSPDQGLPYFTAYDLINKGLIDEDPNIDPYYINIYTGYDENGWPIVTSVEYYDNERFITYG